MTDCPTIKIAIATNIHFEKLTLPLILNSMRDAGIENETIHVFIAGHENRSVEKINEITYYKLQHNTFEYSPLIDIVENELESDYWFLIHDTCKVGPRFKELLYSNIGSTLPEKIALTTKPSMSIGLYKYDYLLLLKDVIIDIKNTDYTEIAMQNCKTWAVQNEDFILWLMGPDPKLPDVDHSMQFINSDNWYVKDGYDRRTEYFGGFDIYKNKSNWGQTPLGNMVIRIEK